MKITQQIPTRTSVGILSRPSAGATSAATSKVTGPKAPIGAPSCLYDPLLHCWRVDGQVVVPDDDATRSPLRSSTTTISLCRATRTSAMAATSSAAPVDTYDATFGRLFGPPPAPSGRRSTRSVPRTSATRGTERAAGLVLDRDYSENIIVPPRARVDMGEIAERYWRTHNFDPIAGRYIDAAKEGRVAAADAAADAAWRRSKYERLPASAKAAVDGGSKGRIFTETEELAAAAAAASRARARLTAAAEGTGAAGADFTRRGSE